jgi:hypothetical protein
MTIAESLAGRADSLRRVSTRAAKPVVKAAMVKVSTNGFIWISQSERVDD